jgi:hypothetical protein
LLASVSSANTNNLAVTNANHDLANDAHTIVCTDARTFVQANDPRDERRRGG